MKSFSSALCLLLIDSNSSFFVSPWCASTCAFIAAAVEGPAGGGGKAGGSYSSETTRRKGGEDEEGAGEGGCHQVAAERESKYLCSENVLLYCKKKTKVVIKKASVDSPLQYLLYIFKFTIILLILSFYPEWKTTKLI